MALEEIIFIILNLVFFIVLLIFITYNVNSKGVYQQAYAKQITLMIDEAKPGTTIFLDITDALKIAGKNFDKTNFAGVDNDGKKVSVSLGAGSYSYNFFSDNNVEFKFQQDEKAAENLIIKIGEKNA